MTTARQPVKPVEIFYSYSRRDEELRIDLEKHLAILKRQGVITGWQDREIGAGSHWGGEIDNHLNTADIVLLLISADFIASHYCYDKEMKLAMERHKTGEARVIPIILRPVIWDGAPFSKLQALPKDSVPVTSWPNRDDAFVSISKGIQTAAQELITQNTTEAVAAQAVAAVAPRVFLSYRRNARPDLQVLELLQQELGDQGYEVLIDRHLTIGTEWLEDIEHQIRNADAVIPLISPTSVTSEMFTYEVEFANKAAQQNLGKPRLLPVRINYEDKLVDPLASILSAKQYALWRGPQDNERVAGEVLTSLRNPPAFHQLSRLGTPGGAVPLDAPHYVKRPTDDLVHEVIGRQEMIVMIKGARQMGKTSLLARGLQQARLADAQVVLTDLQSLDASEMSSAKTFFIRLGRMIAQDLDLDCFPEQVWDPQASANENFERYLRREVLGKISGRLVWGIDEVDRLFTYSYGNDVFGLFRSWFNQLATNPQRPWRRLTLVIVYATEPHLFITDPNMSPFNVGTRLELKDFTAGQVAELNHYFGNRLKRDEAESFHELLNGHPYLVHQGLYEMVTQGITLEQFKDRADGDAGPYSEHLRRILVLLRRDPELCEGVRGMLQEPPVPLASSESFYRLQSAGVISGHSEREARPRCPLYDTFLKRHLLTRTT